MLLAIFITLMSAFLYFTGFSWSDGLTTYNDQTIVYKTNGHGSFGSWHYYTHINDLVHGIEITQDGWHGVPPRSFLKVSGCKMLDLQGLDGLLKLPTMKPVE